MRRRLFATKRKPRWKRRLLLLALALLLLSALPVVALRWINPPTSAFMQARAAEARSQPAPGFVLRYQWVPGSAISPSLPIALVAAEDQKFPLHRGFDVDAIRDALDERSRGEGSRGASSITQQVAKNLFLWSGRSWVRKALESYYTVLIEAFWSKSRIIEVYANIAEFGDGIYGAEAAAQHFFGKPALQLDASESALLAAVLPSPRKYRVDAPGPYVLRRQAWIEQQVRQLGGPDYLESTR